MDEVEKEGFKDLLQTLPRDVLFQLTDTVTKKKIKVADEHEAISALITYSSSAHELFGRQKLKRDYLFAYLVGKGVAVSPSAANMEVIQAVMNYWQEQCRKHKEQQLRVNSLQTVVSPSSNLTVNITQNYNVYNQVIHAPGSGPGAAVAPYQPVCNEQNQQLGQRFVEWFYRELNAKNPNSPTVQSDFGPVHFWDECSLFLLCLTHIRSNDHFVGAGAVSDRLLGLVQNDQLLFNPNVSCEGIKVKSDPHGLVVVLVCGTIHRGNDCVGIFDQMFGLVKDPRLADNWKIKTTKLKIQSSQVLSMPKLTDKSADEIKDLEAVI